MTSKTRILGASIALALLLPLAACGEDAPTDAPDSTLLPNRSEDHLIEGVGPPEQVETDPTPQATTGGEIPGYAPVDRGEGAETGDDATPEADAPANRTMPNLENPAPAAPDPLPAPGPLPAQ
jgi:predicted small lipoprotein YifL